MKRHVDSRWISVSLTEHVQLEERELMFLRAMAQHCSATGMPGSAACEKLDALLHAMGVAVYSPRHGPVYDVFEDE